MKNLKQIAQIIVDAIKQHVTPRIEKLEAQTTQVSELAKSYQALSEKYEALEQENKRFKKSISNIWRNSNDIRATMEDIEQLKSVPDETAETAEQKALTLEDVQPMLAELQEDILKSILTPADGKDGVNGKDGKDGLNGKDGKDGRDGKDAPEIEILPTIEFDKSYPRGTYATHNGGLLRAYQATTGEHGWEVIVNGIKSFDLIKSEDERTVTFETKSTDGTTKSLELSIPTLLDKGIFKEKQVYKYGDCVTFGGSLWIAQKDNAQGKPGESKDWRLSVKRGQNGKDGKDGKDLTKGVKL